MAGRKAKAKQMSTVDAASVKKSRHVQLLSPRSIGRGGRAVVSLVGESSKSNDQNLDEVKSIIEKKLESVKKALDDSYMNLMTKLDDDKTKAKKKLQTTAKFNEEAAKELKELLAAVEEDSLENQARAKTLASKVETSTTTFCSTSLGELRKAVGKSVTSLQERYVQSSRKARTYQCLKGQGSLLSE